MNKDLRVKRMKLFLIGQIIIERLLPIFKEFILSEMKMTVEFLDNKIKLVVKFDLDSKNPKCIILIFNISDNLDITCTDLEGNTNFFTKRLEFLMESLIEENKEVRTVLLKEVIA